VLAEFASVLDTVHCAVEIQERLAQANEAEPEARQMRFRIGISLGDVMVKEGDIFGDGVNVAAGWRVWSRAARSAYGEGCTTTSVTVVE
jgi:class 3 adenylate cyclase